MCGIAGNYPTSFDGRFVYDAASVCRSLAHRGPDDSGLYQSSEFGVSLVHTRLAIQDLSSTGHQPMSSIDSKVWLVFNGEIYNFKDLRSWLLHRGSIFVGNSDTEVILNLYLYHFGHPDSLLDHESLAAFLNRFEGIFSFALWDQTRQLLVVARDSFGVKPLYYTSDDTGFSFSSELKSLPFDDLSLDPSSIDCYLSYLWNPRSGTPVHSVKKLEPGSVLLIKNGLIHEKITWYRLPSFSNSFQPNSSFSSQAALASQARFFIRQAVHRQTVSDVPVGAFLSGGLDSSSIVAFAREFMPDLQCFTIDVRGNDGEGFANDLPYARSVASHLGVPLDVVHVDAARMAASLEEMVWQLDEPLADPAPLNVFFISRLARERGIKVLLSGAGGDDLFTGYRRHLALNYECFWRWLPRRIRFQLRQLTLHLPVSSSFTRRIRKAFSGAHLEGDARLVHYFRWIERSDLSTLYTPAFRASLADANEADPMLKFLADLPKEVPPMERMLALEQRFFLTDHNLTYTDKMSMAAGVEVRVPFLDLDLVEFAARIPSQYKQRGHEGKWVLKKAMEPYLPHDVIYRPKSGFGAPLRRWLRVELRDWLADTLSPERLRSRGLFEPLAVQRLIDANADVKVDATYTLLSLACIEIWCKLFIDQKCISPLKL